MAPEDPQRATLGYNAGENSEVEDRIYQTSGTRPAANSGGANIGQLAHAPSKKPFRP